MLDTYTIGELDGLEDNIESDFHIIDLEPEISIRVVSESLSPDSMRMKAKVKGESSIIAL